MNEPHRIRAAIGFVLSLGAALALTWTDPGPKATLDQRLWSEALWWGATVAVLAYVLLVERRAPSSIGLRPMSWRDGLIALAGAGLLIFNAIVVYLALFAVLILSISMSHVPNLMQMPRWYRAIMVVRLAVAGEILFRAAPIERAADALGGGGSGKWIGAGLSLAGFVAVTWSGWNPVESIATGFAGAIVTGLYLWRRNAGVNMLARAVALGAGYLLH
ncbi:MAG: hypothetical protein JOZ72_14665 [Alphaproteobacteria bacterium]|nr:hypothetical protein [Alphaproteobacteria bacterium]